MRAVPSVATRFRKVRFQACARKALQGARRSAWACALGALGTTAIAADQPPAEESSSPSGFRLGPFQLRPRLNVETIGVDTNVFYSPTDRQADFTAAGGPGLEATLPMGGGLRLRAIGDVGYVFFLRTSSQRRMTGNANLRIDWSGARLEAGCEGGYGRTFTRPSYEVDRRLSQTRRSAGADLRVEVGSRLGVSLEARAARLEFDVDQPFLGVDLRRNLSQDLFVGTATLRHRLTSKSALVLTGDQQMDRFVFEPGRDADSNRLGGGFEVASTTRLSGRAVAGVRRIQLRHREAPEPAPWTPYATVALAYRVGPRTRFGSDYRHDRQYSALATGAASPLLQMDSVTAHVEQVLVARLDLRLLAGLTRFHNSGPVAIEPVPGSVVVAARSDRVRLASADLGYTFFSHLRLGVAASWLERRSTFADFGVRGLLFGATLGYEN